MVSRFKQLIWPYYVLTLFFKLIIHIRKHVLQVFCQLKRQYTKE